ncbi:cytochrome c oxidase assembly factor CtaG [Neobacillus cucumis]|uniref:Cytochrome c oxidase assembly factor CtaG n=1 Tax=Neobacillus cucumis TaxID=1740721 RepID=A0A2N5HLL9_9BACI|nr:cytochrome c oxidase assembly factor CtaG [Neobacillus cucumis]PLS06423.1 cytochrome c oxidase assembly factor CtaG [Neobacillus cucumis]
MLSLDIFGFNALWSPYFLIILLVFTLAFFLITTKFRTKFQNSEPLTTKQASLFLTAMVLLYAIKGSPLDLMGHLMFYIHGITMVLLVFLVPPLFILSIPNWLWRTILNLKGIKPLFILFSKPIVALLLFNAFFSFYHIPIVFDHVMQNRYLHAGYSIILFVFAIGMWWSLICPLPEFKNLTGIKKVAYIFVNSILITPACALIIFSDNSLYATYHDPKVWSQVMSLCVGPMFDNLNLTGPELFSSMSAVEDQRLGGVVMKIIQEVIFAVVLGQVFFEWYRNDQEESEREMKKHVLNPTLE